MMCYLRGPSTLTWELQTGDYKTTLEDKKKIGNLTYYISSESLRDAESDKNNYKLHGSIHNKQ